MSIQADHSGERFNKILVVEKNGMRKRKDGSYTTTYLCRCDCGKNFTLTTQDVSTKARVSCGCARYNWEKNKYETKDDYVIGYDAKGEKFCVDLEDLEKIRKYKWNVNSYTKTVSNNTKGRKTLLLHRFIMDVDDENLEIDHINHDRTDNRKRNLRIVTHADNQKNIPSTNKKNTSGRVGVSYRGNYKGEKNNPWQARIRVKGKLIYGGNFKTFEEAVKRREELEKQYFGEFRNKNM